MCGGGVVDAANSRAQKLLLIFCDDDEKKKEGKIFRQKKKSSLSFIIALCPGRKQILLQIFERFSTRRTNEEDPSAGFERGKSTRARAEGRNVSSRRGRSGAQTRRGVPKSAPRPRPTRRSISPRTAGESDGSARERPRRGRRAQTTFVRIRTHEESRETPRSDGRIAVAGDAGRRRRDERPRVKERCRMSDVLLSPHKKSFNR